MMCPKCGKKEVREFFVDDMNNELTEAEINELTFHEKELAAQCECLDCFHQDAAEFFDIDVFERPSLFEYFANLTRPC